MYSFIQELNYDIVEENYTRMYTDSGKLTLPNGNQYGTWLTYDNSK